MHKCRVIICLLLITTAVAHASGEKKTLFPDLAQGLRLYRYDWDVENLCALRRRDVPT